MTTGGDGASKNARAEKNEKGKTLDPRLREEYVLRSLYPPLSSSTQADVLEDALRKAKNPDMIGDQLISQGRFMETLKVDVCIIGAGSGGLVVASVAAQLDCSVVLIEKDKMGGDCLNTGCVPSKALLAASKVAQVFRKADRFGVSSTEPEINFEQVHKHVHDVIKVIEPNDSVERFEGMGVKVIKATGTFSDAKTLIAGGYQIKARRFVVATGSSAAVPPIPGLDQVSYLTNENIFDLTEKPEHLIIIGGGPIGCEMAQAHRRLGCNVTLLELFNILPKDEPELTDVIRNTLVNDGIDLYESISVERIEKAGNGLRVFIKEAGIEKQISGTHLLISAGRKPNLDELNLEKAGVDFDRPGIKTDARLRSISNKKIFAVGDIAGSYQFTHAAGYQACIAIKNILFGLPGKANYKALPWVTYTDPELSHVGLLEADAKKEGLSTRVLTWSFEENDRAQAEKNTQGQIKVLVNHKGLILGCSIVGAHAGELIAPWTLAIQEKLKIGSMANMIAPYPTLSEISKRVAGSYYTEKLFSSGTKRLVKFIQKVLP